MTTTEQPQLPGLNRPDEKCVVQYRDGTGDRWRRWRSYPEGTRTDCERRMDYLRRTYPQHEYRVVPA